MLPWESALLICLSLYFLLHGPLKSADYLGLNFRGRIANELYGPFFCPGVLCQPSQVLILVALSYHDILFFVFWNLINQPLS